MNIGASLVAEDNGAVEAGRAGLDDEAVLEVMRWW